MAPSVQWVSVAELVAVRKDCEGNGVRLTLHTLGEKCQVYPLDKVFKKLFFFKQMTL